MAGRRHSRSETPPNPAKLVRALRSCRDAMIEATRHLAIGGPMYRAAQVVTAAIDGMAFHLTGDREYFWDQSGGGCSDAHRAKLAERAARERGELPWS